MTVHLYYHRQGKPLDREECARLKSDESYCRLALDAVGVSEVSTVWLGGYSDWDDAGRPLIFETLVLGGVHDERIWRYATESEALAGHADVVRRVRESLS